MDVDKVRKALNIALREHNDLMIKADLPIGSKVIKEALDELDRDNWVSVTVQKAIQMRQLHRKRRKVVV